MALRYQPSSPLLRAIYKLRQKESSDGLTPAEEVKLEQLRDQRQTELERMAPRPSCCQAIRDIPLIHLIVLTEEGDEINDGQPTWMLRLNSEVFTEHLRILRDSGRDPQDAVRPKACFCPFCGKALPPVRKKKTLPHDLAKGIDGSGYCDTCGERVGRYGGCLCAPPEAAYEVFD